MINIQDFSEKEIESIVLEIFSPENTYHSIEEAYQKLAKTMFNACRTDKKENALVLSRIFHSFKYQSLPTNLQKTAKNTWSDVCQHDSRLLVLMGTYGIETEWCNRTQSEGHKTIILSNETISNIPMVARLIQQLGFDIGLVIGKNDKEKNDKEINLDVLSNTFGVFYVADAENSPYIPAQDFVSTYGVKTVIGTGVMLPQGDICVYIGFSRAFIDQKVAANIAPLMSFFWQQAYPIMMQCGMFR